MYARKKYLCVKVRKNNGIIEAMFMRDEDGQPEVVHVNELCEPDKYEVGKHYWWNGDPAFPY